jgi:hypothetical protein
MPQHTLGLSESGTFSVADAALSHCDPSTFYYPVIPAADRAALLIGQSRVFADATRSAQRENSLRPYSTKSLS